MQNSKNTERSGFQSIVHVNEKAGRFGGTEEYIDTLVQTCTAQEIQSYLVYGKKHGAVGPDLELVEVPGLEDRDASVDVSHRVRAVIDKLQPDVVYVHNLFDGRILQALGKPERSYALLMYIHDHYLTCLTELRARHDEKNTCQE